MQVDDFIQEFRNNLGDSSSSIPSTYILSYLNNFLQQCGFKDGLDRMFQHHDTFELASVNKDGTAAASWDLGNIGKIIDIQKMRMLKTSDSGIVEVRPSYREYDDFFDLVVFPEQNQPGDPAIYTVEQVSLRNKLMFDRPPVGLVAIDLIFTAFHERLTSLTDMIHVDYSMMPFIQQGVTILHKIETTDMATARALYEDLDTLYIDIRETLAKRKSSLGYRRVRRSF